MIKVCQLDLGWKEESCPHIREIHEATIQWMKEHPNEVEELLVKAGVKE